MSRDKGRSQNLIILEFLIDFCIFLISISVCFGLLSYTVAKKGEIDALNKAVVQAIEVSEKFKSSSDIDEFISMINADDKNDCYNLYFDRGMLRSDNANCIYIMRLKIQEDIMELSFLSPEEVYFSWSVTRL